MLPDLPMPGATDPTTACGTPVRDYRLLLIPVAGESIMKQMMCLSCWGACSNNPTTPRV